MGKTMSKTPKQSFLSEFIGLIRFGSLNLELDSPLVHTRLEHAKSWSCLYTISEYMERPIYNP
jgi:hypothetical protein